VPPSRFDCGHAEVAYAEESAPIWEADWGGPGREGGVSHDPQWQRPERSVSQLRFGEQITQPVLRYGRVFAIGRSGALRALELSTGEAPLGWHRESEGRLPLTRATSLESLRLRSSSGTLYVQLEEYVHIRSIVDGTPRTTFLVGASTECVIGDRWLVVQSSEAGCPVLRVYPLAEVTEGRAGRPTREWYLGSEVATPRPPTPSAGPRAGGSRPWPLAMDARDRVLAATPDYVYYWDPGSVDPPAAWLRVRPNEELLHCAVTTNGLYALVFDGATGGCRFARRLPSADPVELDCPLPFTPAPPRFAIANGKAIFFSDEGSFHLLSLESLEPWSSPVFAGRVGGEKRMHCVAGVPIGAGVRVVGLYQSGNAKAEPYYADFDETGAHGGANTPREDLTLGPARQPALAVGDDFVVGLELKEGIGLVRQLD
jgi:hypothetical protein